MNVIQKERRSTQTKNNYSNTNEPSGRTAGFQEEPTRQLSTGAAVHEFDFAEERDYAHWGLNE